MFLGQQDVRLPAKADIFEYEYIPLWYIDITLVKKEADVWNTLICRTTCESVVTDDFLWYACVAPVFP